MLLAYIARRFLLTIPAMLAMSVIVFLIIRLVPGDPVMVILGLRATPESIATLRAQLNLDDPLVEQYLRWLGNLLQGDLGVDFRTHEPIREMLLSRLPVTLELAVMAMLMSALIGIPLGILAATRGGVADSGATGLGFVGISIPDFWLGVILILVFSLELRWLPSSGWVPMRESIWGNISHLLLPAFTLAINFAAVLTRTTRGAVLDVPVATVMGLQFGYALGGAVIIEQVFSLPGVGRLTLNAVLERNYPVIQGAVLLVTFMFMLVNILTDALHAVIDPRVRLGNS
jgi:peptide/nickel transport system permease protein